MDANEQADFLEEHRLWLESDGERGKRAEAPRAHLDFLNLSRSNLRKADFQGASLIQTNFRGADLREANLVAADLTGADLSGADLREARLNGVSLIRTSAAGADLRGANLMTARLVDVNLESAKLSGCLIYGTSVWDLRLNHATEQSDLVITPTGVSTITADSLEVGQFIYLLLNNEKVREVIDTVTSRVVLILGRFSPERKAALDEIRQQLRQKNLAPVMFDFDKPASKDLTGTVETLARMARFVVADLTEPSSAPHELATIVPHLRTTPIVPIRLKGSGGYSMFDGYAKSYEWVLPTYEYDDVPSLLASLDREVIQPAAERLAVLRPTD